MGIALTGEKTGNYFVLTIAVAILLLAFALRIYFVRDANYTWDEGYSSWIVNLPFADMLETTANDVHPPLYYTTLRLMTNVAGDDLFTLRFPSILFGVLSVALTYALGRTSAGYSVGLFAMLLMALSHVNIDISQTARSYIMSTVFCTGALWATVLVLRKHQRLWPSVLYTVFLTGALYSFYLAVMLPIVTNLVFLYSWIRQGKPSRLLLVWIVPHVVFAVLFIPWLFYAIHDVAVAGDVPSITIDFFVKFYFLVLTVGIDGYWGSYLPSVLVVLGITTVGSVLIWKKISGQQRDVFMTLVAAVFVPMIIIFIMTQPHKRGWPLASRYLPLLVAGFYVLVTWAVFELWRKQRWLGFICAGFVVMTLLTGTLIRYEGRVRGDIFLSLADTLDAYRHPNDAVVLHNDSSWTLWHVNYDGAWLGTSFRWNMDAAAANEFLVPVWQDADAVWLIITPDSLRTDPAQAVEQWLEDHSIATKRWKFNKNQLVVYVRTEDRIETLDWLAPEHDIPDNFKDRLDGAVGMSFVENRYHVSGTVYFPIYWENPPQDQVAIKMVGGNYEKSFYFDTPDMIADQVVRQVIDIPLSSDVSGGTYGLYSDDILLHEINVINTSSHATVEVVELEDIPNALNWSFGESIELLGYDVSATELNAGDELDVSLYWRTDDVVSERYKVLVYILGEFNPVTNDPLWGQHDSEPFNWQLPTSRWPTDVVLMDQVVLELADNASPGEYQLGIVLYNMVGGERLLIRDADGNLLGDMVTIIPIEIR